MCAGLFTIETEDTIAGHLLHFLNHESLGDTRDGHTCLTSEKIETQTGSTHIRSLHLRVHNGGVPLPASSLDLELPRSVTKAIHLACWVFNFAKSTPSSSKDMKSWGKKTQAPTEALCLCFFTFLWQLCNEGSSPAAARRSSSAWQDIKSEKTPWVATKCYKCPLPSSLPHVLPRPGATNAIRNAFYMCIVYMEILQFRLCD